MTLELIAGSVVVTAAGLISGSAAWPMKLMRKYQFEHWWFIGMATGLIVAPWTITLTCCPHAFQACASMALKPLVVANLLAAGWGVANIICGACYVRIGLALTTAILSGVGLSIGAIVPMILKGSGVFHQAADLASPAGLTVLAGIGVMLVGTVSAGLAGFGRERVLAQLERKSGKFPKTLVLIVAAGVLSCGMSLSFVYGQETVVAAMERGGAAHLPATFAVWAFCLPGGAFSSLAYPIWLMTRNKSWDVLGKSWKEMLLAAVIGINLAAAVALLGSGMLMLGPLGATVGFGIQQAAWMLGGQGAGFISGEWRNVRGRPRKQMGRAIGLMLVAILIMACANALVRP
jgi:L-rhamnose-H+ transport protein